MFMLVKPKRSGRSMFSTNICLFAVRVDCESTAYQKTTDFIGESAHFSTLFTVIGDRPRLANTCAPKRPNGELSTRA